ncbi:MAG: BT4734/BF3469 family protein, partial [Kiritimatiellota bacterium]|nr:BT4734/BF3469 family protein [Kiritimatiellota bacterium]
MTASTPCTKAALISMFETVHAKNNVPVAIDTILDDIRDGKWREPVERVRVAFTNDGKDAADQLKKLLPAVTFSGMFSGPHKAEALTAHSGILCLDFDGINGRLAEVRPQLEKDPYRSAVFISPGGVGLKFLMKIKPDATEHGRAFDAAAAYFKKTYNLEADKSGRDVCRLCFVSYDPELVHKPDAAIFETPPAPQPKPRPMPAQKFDDIPDRAKIEDALRHVSANCSFDDWLRIGMALHSWSPGEGRAIWDLWSRTAPERYQEAAIGQHWKAFKPGAVTIATLFKQAMDAGWKPARKIPQTTTAKLPEAKATRPEAATPEPEPWEKPVGFDAPINLPGFPVDVLPEPFNSFVADVSASKQVPTALTGPLVLGAVAMAVAKRFRVYIGQSHDEPLNLFSLALME